jgi:HPr kinase/phosphorylase
MSLPAAVLDPEQHLAAARNYIHASALVVGEAGLLIRGNSGAGKSRLVLALIAEAARRGLFARLVGDDRVSVEPRGERLVARPHPAIAGKVEQRGEGILAADFEAAIVVRLVIDLGGPASSAGARLPEHAEGGASICGIKMPRLRLDGGAEGWPAIVLEWLRRQLA